MKIAKVQIVNPAFTSSPKRRFLTQDVRCSVESLLIRMNSEVDRVKDGDRYKTTIIKKLNFDNKASFEDERRLTKKLNQKEQMQGFSVLKIGKKTVLDIDNEKGEIVDYKKPFYKPWFLVFKQAKNILFEMRAKFYDSDVVRRETLTINELTPDGEKKMKKFVLQVEKQQLEEVVKELESTGK